MNQFNANTGAMNGWQGIVDGVSGEVSSFKNSAPGASNLMDSHGAIGFPMQNAFDGAQSSRDGALGATQMAAGRMAELLGQASKAYERGDLAAAGRLKAQADQIEGAGAPAAAGAGGANAASAGGGAGQMMGQMSQMAGQMAQSITQPLQGLTQAFGQMPQQVMQGVQGIVEAATQAAGGGGDAAALAASAGADAGGTGAEHAVQAADHHGANDGSDGGPTDPQDDKQDSKDDKGDTAEHRKHDGDRDHSPEAGANRSYEQLVNRSSAGATAEDGFGIGPVPTQVRNINPRQQ